MRAFIILEAARITSNADIPALDQLLVSNPLKAEHVLRILLTFLPKGTDPFTYTDFVRRIAIENGNGGQASAKAPTCDITDTEACDRVRKMHLLPLATPLFSVDDTDPLSLFLIHQAYRIDADTGSLDLVVKLLEPFVGHSGALQSWMISNLLPLLRLDYEYYPKSRDTISLGSFGQMSNQEAIRTLLSRAISQAKSQARTDFARDLRGMVGPYMYGEPSRKRRKLNSRGEEQSNATWKNTSDVEGQPESTQYDGWSFVNELLLQVGVSNFDDAVAAFMKWDGPTDVDMGNWITTKIQNGTAGSLHPTRGYAQAALAIVYDAEASGQKTLHDCHDILRRVAGLMRLWQPPEFRGFDGSPDLQLSSEFLESLSPSYILKNSLLLPHNQLTSPTSEALLLLNYLLSSSNRLHDFGILKSLRTLAHLSLFGNGNDQRIELTRTLSSIKSQKRNERQWCAIRNTLLWLRCWQLHPRESNPLCGPFSNIPEKELEIEIMKAMVEEESYSVAAEIYCQGANSPIAQSVVKDITLQSAFAAYDAASNGNKSRGGLRKASEIVTKFRNSFPTSKEFAQIAALIAATHAMSFYSLTLQHGVPLRPVNIRAHKDPISLIGRILNQNEQSYTQLDDLLGIGENLVNAGLCGQDTYTLQVPEEVSHSKQLIDTRRRITRMAIEAALRADDFETAYSYVVNRLSSISHLGSGMASPGRDDISWRAAFAAGRYPTGNSSRSAVRRLEQRMELLSQALLLAPPPSLTEVLQEWQKCEQQMAELVADEAAEDDEWDKQGDQKIPGGFSEGSGNIRKETRNSSRGALLEEAPMGLFQVARGAASALSKNAFPLPGSGTNVESKADPSDPISHGVLRTNTGEEIAGTSEGTGRVRKRDMVSNMVTGGLVSGIGWVIGESDRLPLIEHPLTKIRSSTGRTRAALD